MPSTHKNILEIVRYEFNFFSLMWENTWIVIYIPINILLKQITD